MPAVSRSPGARVPGRLPAVTPDPALETIAVEVEAHVGSEGWDQPVRLFALVPTAGLVAAEPALAASLGLLLPGAPALTPVEQEGVPTGDLADVLAGIGWPPEVAGCALVQEIVLLPPDAEDELAEQAQADTDLEAAAAYAAAHPDRREARLVAAVTGAGASAAVLRLRAGAADGEGGDGDLLTGPEIAPNLTRALAATLEA